MPREGDRQGDIRPGSLAVSMRSPDLVMRLDRLGAMHATRLSFMSAMLRRVADEGWRCSRPVWRFDARGVGVAVYEAAGPRHVYSLVAFGHDLPPEKRTDRVIAEQWDATFALFDGRPTEADLSRLAANVPKQEAGRVSDKELSLLRANRSVRLFDTVVQDLAAGRQPDAVELDRVGYLMRTTAVYGSGKFGLSDRERVADRPELAGPFRAEMLAVWLARAFTTDLAEHLARMRSPTTAVAFDRDLRRRLGVGNSTGLGLAPFVVNHPTLLGRWIEARETALARVRSEPVASPAVKARFLALLERARAYAASWRVDDAGYTKRIGGLERDLAAIETMVAGGKLDVPRPWDALYRRAAAELGLEAQELLVTLLLEPQGPLIDDLAEAMASEESRYFAIDGGMTIEALARLVEASYHWAIAESYEAPERQARFWYTSVEKLEPRLGERFEEPGGELEQPLAIGRDVQRLYGDLAAVDKARPVAEFLAHHPEHRHVIRRIQSSIHHPYQEIRDNLIDARMQPIDILRCKLAFFGAQRFDPKSDRWLRISLFPNAPFPDEIDASNADDWTLPPLPRDPAPTLDVSLNEIEVMVKRAARGAGYAWGLAEEAGKAVRWLESRGLPGLEAMLRHFESGTRAGSPIIAGPGLADRAHELAAGTSLGAKSVSEPLLMLPFAAMAAKLAERSVDLSWPGVRFRGIGGAATIDGQERASAPGPVDLTLGPASGALDGSPLAERIAGITVAAEIWTGLNRFAVKTYVPESEGSRTKGAGAGAIDND
ncbi:MAG: DUF3726 domain-containing protein [Hyphomicrobiaceae bacterium]